MLPVLTDNLATMKRDVISSVQDMNDSQARSFDRTQNNWTEVRDHLRALEGLQESFLKQNEMTRADLLYWRLDLQRSTQDIHKSIQELNLLLKRNDQVRAAEGISGDKSVSLAALQIVSTVIASVMSTAVALSWYISNSDISKPTEPPSGLVKQPSTIPAAEPPSGPIKRPSIIPATEHTNYYGGGFTVAEATIPLWATIPAAKTPLRRVKRPSIISATEYTNDYGGASATPTIPLWAVPLSLWAGDALTRLSSTSNQTPGGKSKPHILRHLWICDQCLTVMNHDIWTEECTYCGHIRCEFCTVTIDDRDTRKLMPGRSK